MVQKTSRPSAGLKAVWRHFVHELGVPGCTHARRILPWRRNTSAFMKGQRYCIDQCLERALIDTLTSGMPAVPHPRSHRVPLGLMLLSRRTISEEQLRTALDLQRQTGNGRIGEHLQKLGYVSEEQITSAIARQWSCPVLQVRMVNARVKLAPQIPTPLLEAFEMVPVDYIPGITTLHIAFGGNPDYRALYAVEQITGCHTEPCMTTSAFVRHNITLIRRERPQNEIVFDHVWSVLELARIILSYCGRLNPDEIRIANCGPFVWAQFARAGRSVIDLVARASWASADDATSRPA